MRFDAAKIKTMVVKIGTNLLSGKRAFEGLVLDNLVQEICRLKQAYPINILLVSSGAIGCGMNTLHMQVRPTALPLKQAVAAVGQATLMHYYETLFKTYGEGLCTAQVLLTLADLDNRRAYLNVRNTLHALFDMKAVIPILNENDTTAVDELRFSDNDTLAARIAAKMNADLLIILSDVDGLYDKNPALNPKARLIPHIEMLTPEIEAEAGGPGTHTATGGMRTKLDAVRIACAAGVPSVIANGLYENILHGILDGTAPCTTFAASAHALPHRKRWIAFGRATHGALLLDEGACKAVLNQGKSLLPAGISGIEGTFEAGDAVEIRSPEGKVIGRGLVNYSSRDLKGIIGRKSSEIAAILGRKDFDEVIHRDNLVLSGR